MANTINVTSDTVVKLIIRRGTNADRQGIVLANGELGYAYDIKRVFVGDGITLGGSLVGNQNFGIVQGIENYTNIASNGLAQPGDMIFQDIKSDGAADNTLYAFNNGQWQSISPVYGAPFDYASGALLFNSTYLSLDTVNSILNVYGGVNSYTLSANSSTIYNAPVFGTDGVNLTYLQQQIAGANAFTVNYVGNNYVPLSGSATMFGTLSSTVNVCVSTVPVNGNDLTNKSYVDQAIFSSLTAVQDDTNNRYLHLSGGILTNSLSSVVVTNNAPAVYINQRGNAPALVIQDVNRTTAQSFYVDNYGSVGIGVVPPTTPVTNLSILGTVSASSNITSNTITVNSLTGSTINATGNLYVGGNVTTAGTISAAGDVIAYYTSDARLKDNITPITSALDKIDSINGVSYDWNTDLQDTYAGHDVGVLAQEIESVLPEAVITRPNGYKAVNYEKIIPLLIQAIKELKAAQNL